MKRLRILRRWFARKFGYARLVCLALLIGFAALRIADPAPIEELRVRTFDTFQRIDPRVKTARPVTIVDIDEKSLAKLGQWPWPRTRIADIVTNLTRLGAVVIAFDVMFSEPDRLNPDVAADTFRNLDEETRAKLRALPSNDQIFADAIRHSRVVLGESGLPEVHSELDKTLPVTGLAMLGEDPQPFMFEFPGAAAQHRRCWKRRPPGAACSRSMPERDGIVRRVPMIMQAQGATMPSLSFEMLRVVTGTDTIIIKSDQAGIKSIGVKGFRDSDRPQRPALGSFRASRSLDLRLGGRRARRQRRAGKDRGQAGADRNLGGRAERHQDHAGRRARCRASKFTPRCWKRADPAVLSQPLTARRSNSAPRCCSDFW